MAYIYDLTDTWNAGGTTFYGIKMNVTNSASASGSKLLSLQVSGSEKFGVDKDGNVGVGVTSPSGRLHTALDTTFAWGGAWSSGAAVFGGTSSTSGAVAITYNDTDGAVIGAVDPGDSWKDLSFYGDMITIHTNGSTERVRVDNTGNVGVGTSAPSCLLDVNADKVRVRTAKTPSSASDSGNAGDICWDSSYVYVCVAANTWKRTAISTW